MLVVDLPRVRRPGRLFQLMQTWSDCIYIVNARSSRPHQYPRANATALASRSHRNSVYLSTNTQTPIPLRKLSTINHPLSILHLAAPRHAPPRTAEVLAARIQLLVYIYILLVRTRLRIRRQCQDAPQPFTAISAKCGMNVYIRGAKDARQRIGCHVFIASLFTPRKRFSAIVMIRHRATGYETWFLVEGKEPRNEWIV